ncbi:MAG TPA: hypothetical protein PK747_02180 [Acidobacteriota bacterium]|nr:hypothetical protein [Acidobacteriota bacterium]HQQ46201.1 hypothetical protein [Acidobacteriota bacterium]
MGLYSGNDGGFGTLPPVFLEVQNLRSVPIAIPALLALAVVFAAAASEGYRAFTTGKPFTPAAVLLAALGILFSLLFYARLEIEVNQVCLRYRFFPFLPFWREFQLSSIESAEAVRYRPILEFGGWGIRYGKGMWAYTMSGKDGVVVRLRGGKTFMLGTRHPDKLEKFIRTPS